MKAPASRFLRWSLVVVLAACTPRIDPSPATTSNPTATEFATPSLLAGSPTAAPTERELSDRLWAQAFDYRPSDVKTLEDIVLASDLIVSGRIAGKTIADCPAAPSPPFKGPDVCDGGGRRSFAIVAVDAVLKHDGRHAAGTVMVGLSLTGIQDSDLPRGELVLFLRNYGTAFVEAGVPTASDSPRWHWYYPATSFQGAIRNLDGVVDVPAAPEGWWDQFGPFPSDVDGQPFDQVVDRIRALVGS